MVEILKNLDEVLLNQGFHKCRHEKPFTWKELVKFLEDQDTLLRERGHVINDVYLRVMSQDHPHKYIIYLRTDSV